jgi:hypothetical protein
MKTILGYFARAPRDSIREANCHRDSFWLHRQAITGLGAGNSIIHFREKSLFYVVALSSHSSLRQSTVTRQRRVAQPIRLIPADAISKVFVCPHPAVPFSVALLFSRFSVNVTVPREIVRGIKRHQSQPQSRPALPFARGIKSDLRPRCPSSAIGSAE